ADLVDHPADGRRVLQHALAPQPGQAQAAQRLAVLLGVAAHPADQLHFQCHLRLPAPRASPSAPCRASGRLPRGCAACRGRPAPTWPWPSPTTTSAEKEKRRPPFTTLATRLMWTTRSFNSGRSFGLIGAAIVSPCLRISGRPRGRPLRRPRSGRGT